MKRIYLVMLSVGILFLIGCGGRQLVWVDVDETSGAETAAPASSAYDVPQPIIQDKEEEPAERIASEPDEVDTAEEMMNDAVTGTMASNVVNGAMAQIEAAIEETAVSGGEEADLSEAEALAVQLMTDIPEVADWLASFPDWTGNAWQDGEDGRFYTVDLYSESAEEWLGWGYVNVVDGVVDDYFVPRELSAEEFQQGLAMVEAFVFSDEEVLARLGNVENWDYDTWYNRWDANWQVWFWYGLEELAVTVNIWDGAPYLDGIDNPAAFEAEEAAEHSKNQAIELAWQADGIDQALAGSDNWQTYVSQQGDNLWAVSFATADEELFYALVDIENWTILESD